jgi:phage terminase large subunit-like protein
MPTSSPATQGGHLAAFAREYCRHTKGRWAGQPVAFEPWQQAFIDEAYRLDDDGRRVYRNVLLGLPRKNGKSTIAATLALYHAGADGEAGAEVIIAAGSRDQAGIVFDQARAFVEASEDLGQHFDAQRFVIYGPTGSTIKRVAADGRMQHGTSPSAVILDELHALETPRQEELYAALNTASGAREQPMNLAITTAGYNRHTILGRLYADAMRLPDVRRDGMLTIARDPAAGFLMWWYGLADDDEPTPENVLAANPASWITSAVLEAQRESPTVDEYAFRRLHANQWTSTRNAWLPAGAWEALGTEGYTIPDGSEVVVAVDVGLVHDSTAVAIGCRLPDGRIALDCRVWAARDDAVAHIILPGGRVDLGVVEDYIESLADRYSVRELVYDPRFFERSASALSAAGFITAPVDQASRRMAEAYATFYTAVQDGRVVHPVDPVLSAHVEATQSTMTERGWRIGRQRLQRIDACVAMCMALWRADRDEQPAEYVLSWDGLDDD